MAETIKCNCPKCGAKYRLAVEAQGRTARCKKCGAKFKVPQQKSLEDSVLDWLSEPEKEETEVSHPRVISMPKEPGGEDTTKRIKGPIRLKEGSQSPG